MKILRCWISTPRWLVGMAIALIQSYLLLRDGRFSKRKLKLSQTFIARMQTMIEEKMAFITSDGSVLLENFGSIINEEEQLGKVQ